MSIHDVDKVLELLNELPALDSKADKIKKSARNKNISVIRKKLGLSGDTPVIPFSSVTKEGKDEIWEYIDYFVKEIPI